LLLLSLLCAYNSEKPSFPYALFGLGVENLGAGIETEKKSKSFI
jgi:hypothetical protein